MTLLGNLALWLALLLAVWGAVTGFAAGARARADLEASSRRAVYATCAALLGAVAALEVALFRHDFNVEYVWAYTSRNLPVFYTWSALYAGQKGSLLFWAAVLSIFGSLALFLSPRRYRVYLPYVAAIVSVVIAFFVTVMITTANPFDRLAFTPPDGRGLNPQLQNPGMVFHPPMLYLGYITITIPYAFAMSALLTKRLEADWLAAIRKWTLVAWLFLSIGLLIGMWWAYVELGWGGYWAWDPVENAALLPWLTLTAFLHSVMVQEKRGMLKKWNLALILGSWLLSIFGTFLTRSGVIASVHSFTQSGVGYFFLGFLVVAAVASFAVYARRLPLLEAESRLESMVSREASFLFNNLLLVGIAFSVLWGTLFPILSEWVQGTKVTVGPPFFNQVNVPIGLALLALAGIGPLIAWRRASLPNLRRYGGYIVHVGIVTLFIAFAGMAFKTETQATLQPGEQATLESPYGHTYTFTHLGVSQYEQLNRFVTAATVDVMRDGKRLGILKTEKRQHQNALGNTFEPSTEVGIMSNAREDLYMVLAGVVGGTEEAVFRFTLNPLVWWVGLGRYVVVFGGLVVMWPGGGAPALRRTQAGYAVKVAARADRC